MYACYLNRGINQSGNKCVLGLLYMHNFIHQSDNFSHNKYFQYQLLWIIFLYDNLIYHLV